MPTKIPQDIVNQLIGFLQADEIDFRAFKEVATDVLKKDESFQGFTVDAKTLIHLGRDSIKDHTTALIELVKNSYDADAYDVDVQIFSSGIQNLIRVADNGFGMTKEELVKYWLRIGFSNKRQSKTSEFGRRKTGEKGIGRISTDRLGARLELKTKSKNSGPIGLRVNWDDFDVEGKDISDIQVELFIPESITIPQHNGLDCETGTEINITELRQVWLPSNIENLYYELASLTPPFKSISDFKINLTNDIAPEFSKPVNPEYLKTSEIEVTAIFDGTDEVFYNIKDKYHKQEKTDTIKLNQFYQKVYNKSEPDDFPPMNCGKLEVRLLFFLREASSVIGTKFSLSDLKEFLNNNNGVKIYRDDIAVKPYGFPKAQLGYDWLGLGDRKSKNPAGAGRSDDYMVSPYQLVGAVFIGRDSNLQLLDSAAREGLVESEEFFDMKNFVMATLRLLESHRAEIFPTIEKIKGQKEIAPGHREAERIKNELNLVYQDLDGIMVAIETKGDEAKPKSFLNPLSKAISKVQSITKDVDTSFSELLTWQRTLSGLATMGISSAVFGHETEGYITQFQGSTSTALKLLGLDPPGVQKAMIELEKAVQHSKRVAAWGAYALTRVQREKRIKKTIHIYKTLDSVICELQPAFEASNIDIKLKGASLYSKTYQMDVESILVNLLTNAYTACTLTKRERKVLVDVNLEDRNGNSGFYFSVADTGPGIPKEFKDRIFEPLFSTKAIGSNESKSVGTGLGLTIVKSIVEELNGEIEVDFDKELKGAIFKIWLHKA